MQFLFKCFQCLINYHFNLVSKYGTTRWFMFVKYAYLPHILCMCNIYADVQYKSFQLYAVWCIHARIWYIYSVKATNNSTSTIGAHDNGNQWAFVLFGTFSDKNHQNFSLHQKNKRILLQITVNFIIIFKLFRIPTIAHLRR